MKYAVIKVVNGAFSIDAEGYTNKTDAITRYHGTCQSLWNAPDVNTASVSIINENQDCIDGYREIIDKTPVNP